MSKHRKPSYNWVKSYFKKHFPHVKEVVVNAHQNNDHDFDALLKVKAGKKWFVVKKKGHDLSEALKKAKEGMSVKIRKEWQKFKDHKALVPQEF